MKKKLKETLIKDMLPYDNYDPQAQEHYYNRDDVLNTELDINDVACIDVEKVEKLIRKKAVQMHCEIGESNLSTWKCTPKDLAEAISTAGVLRWKEPEKEKK